MSHSGANEADLSLSDDWEVIDKHAIPDDEFNDENGEDVSAHENKDNGSVVGVVRPTHPNWISTEEKPGEAEEKRPCVDNLDNLRLDDDQSPGSEDIAEEQFGLGSVIIVRPPPQAHQLHFPVSPSTSVSQNPVLPPRPAPKPDVKPAPKPAAALAPAVPSRPVVSEKKPEPRAAEPKPKSYKDATAVAAPEVSIESQIGIRAGIPVSPGEKFYAGWRLKNFSSALLDSKHSLELKCTGGSNLGFKMGAIAPVSVPRVPIGSEVDILLELEAPKMEGRFFNIWILYDRVRGVQVGPILHVEVTVGSTFGEGAFKQELDTLEEMGFTDRNANLKLLQDQLTIAQVVAKHLQ